MIFGASDADESTLSLPRILCLHGGGTNAKIFRAQCRVLERDLQSTFRLCFAQAPFPASAGPDVTAVYSNFGPYRAWLRWRPEDPARDRESALEQIEESLRTAMADDDEKGATGEWVALLGFSQGAKMCASLLFSQQAGIESFVKRNSWPSFRFAVLMAGRGPLVSLASEDTEIPGLYDPSSLSPVALSDEQDFKKAGHSLRIPTIHVHGMQDPGLELHRKMLRLYCDKSQVRLIEWDGEHRIPIKSKDVAVLVEEILSVAQDTKVSVY